MRIIRNATVTTGAGVSTLVSEVKSSTKRVVLEISNLAAAGGNDTFISIDAEAKTSEGRRIQAGQTIVWSTDGGYTPPQGQVNAIAAAATALSVYEEIEV